MQLLHTRQQLQSYICNTSRFVQQLRGPHSVVSRGTLAVLTSPTRSTGDASRERAVEALERTLSLDTAPRRDDVAGSSPPAPGRSKRVIDAGEVLHSTWEHRLWVWGPTALMGLLLLDGLSKIHTTGGVLEAAVGVVFSYYLSGGCSSWHSPSLSDAEISRNIWSCRKVQDCARDAQVEHS